MCNQSLIPSLLQFFSLAVTNVCRPSWEKLVQESVVVVLFVLCLVESSIGQGLLLKNYTTEDGLPDSRVAPIFQDREGYMWFGTQAGLTRYDGSEFKNFSEAKEIPGIFGRDICQDGHGAIWFAHTGFHRGGLTRLWNGNVTEFTRAQGLLGDQANAVIEDRNQDIWVAMDGGLNRIHFTDSSRNLWVIDSFPQFQIHALYVDRHGVVWLGGGGLFSYTGGVFRDELKRLAVRRPVDVRAYAIYESSEGDLWVGGYTGILRIRDSSWKFYGIPEGLPDRGVWSFGEDRQMNFWIGTMHGLYRFVNKSGIEQFVKEESFGDAVVYDICLDHEGNVWFASAPGVRKLLASDFFLDFPGKDILASPGIGPIQQDHDGKIYFGSRNTGVYIMDHNVLSRFPISDFTVTSIVPESSRRVWFGIWRGGVLVQDGKNSRHYDVSNGLSSNAVHALARTSENLMFVGTSAGLCSVDSNGNAHHLENSSLDTLSIFDIKISRAIDTQRDTLWLATQRGVRRLEIARDSILAVTALEGMPLLSNIIVYDLLIDREGRLWIGTDGAGVIRYNGSTFTQFTNNEGLVGNRVYALAEDSSGNIWVGTSSGLSQFDGTSFRNFTAREGFSEIGIHGLMVDPKGDLWVSNFPGVAKVHPEPIVKSDQPPPIYITNIFADSTRLSSTEPTELSPDVAAISFQYAGLSFTDESNVRYKYILEGYDKAWSMPVKTREVRYTHLPAGKYTFQVVARNSRGVWTAIPAAISFNILPPIWQRWWFVLGMTALFVAVIYGAYRYRLEKLLEIERTRSRIAMDLHDDIGSNLTRISMMAEVARRQEPSSGERNDYLQKIGDTARELIDALGDIVWSVDPTHDDLQHVIRRIVQFGQEICEGSSISFETEIAHTFDEAKLSLDQRRDIYLIFREAINNVLQHSQATIARFSVRQTSAGAILEISDNGIGVSTSQNDEGEGLRSMKTRGQRLGARLLITGEPTKGTRVSLEVKTG